MFIPQEHEATRIAVRQLRETHAKLEDVDIAQSVANYIYNTERANGSRFLLVDGQPRLFSAITRQLYELTSKSRHWSSHLFAVYGLNSREKFSNYVTQCLESHCQWTGEPRSVRRWTCWQDGVLHISNYDGTTWRITGNGVTIDPVDGRVIDDGWGADGTGPPIGIGIVPNGSDVVFADDDEGKTVPNPVIGRNGKLFKLLGDVTWANETAGGMLPKQQTLTMVIWMFAIAFPDLFPTKPLLIIEGAPGGGKSALMQMIQAALHGSVAPIIVSENGEKDFRVSLLRSPIAVLDNTDDYIKWLPNALAAYATGAGWSDRELFTNQGVVKLRPHAFIAVASKNPVSFKQDDVADRSIILRTERRKEAISRRNAKRRRNDRIEAKANRLMRRILDAIFEGRGEIYGEWLYFLNRIVAVINAGGFPETADHRMADWEGFSWVVARAFNWPQHLIADQLRAMQGERTAFASENDVVVELLDQWLDQSGNEMRWVTVRDLYRELKVLAEFDGKTFVKSPMAMSHRLRAPHVVNRYFVDDTRVDTTGRKLYQIARNDPNAPMN